MVKLNKKITLKDIGRELNLSAKAVSSALNNTGRLAPETREKIIATAHAMGYVPNAAARSLVTQRSNLIGVLIPYLNRSFFCNIIQGIEEVAGKKGFMLLLDSLCKNGTAAREQVIHSLMQRQVDGLILYPRKEDLEIAPLIRSMGIPVVQVMESMPEFGPHSVTMDNFMGACDAVNHLISRGHSHVGCLFHKTGSDAQNERLRGYMKTMGRRKKLYTGCRMTLESGYQKTLEMFEEDPELSAVFATSDYAAVGALRAALEKGRKVPEEFAVVGFSDAEFAANQALFPLTTITQPKEETGRCAAAMLAELICGNDAGNIILPAPLTVRQSS